MGLTLCDQSVQSVKGIAKNSRPNNKRSRNSEFWVQKKTTPVLFFCVSWFVTWIF